MRFLFILLISLKGLLVPGLEAQQRVDARNLYERVICIVPMVGRGTYEDPKRPLFAPVAMGDEEKAAGRGIVSFSYQLSDDGKFAVMEMVARDRREFWPVLGGSRPDVKVFERGRSDPAVVEAEIRKYLKDFDLSRFGARAN